jgi:hypothetical protein
MKISVSKTVDVQLVSRLEDMEIGVIYQDVEGDFMIKGANGQLTVIIKDDGTAYVVHNAKNAVEMNAPLTRFNGKITLSND